MRVILLSNSCTTGWASWGHGELWLTPDSIVRIGKKSLTRAEIARGGAIGIGLVGGLAGGAAAGVVVAMTRANTRDAMDVTPPQWNAYLRGCSSVIELPLSQVRRFTVKPGLGTSALDVTLRNGRRYKFLWKRNPTAVELLRRSLAGLASPTPES